MEDYPFEMLDAVASPEPEPEYAFPQSVSAGSMAHSSGGLTLRDYIAIRSVPAVMQANPDWVNYHSIAFDSYKFADAMIAAREAAK